MPVILLSINNPKESVTIKQFLLKNNIQVVTCLSSYNSFIKGLQYEPDLVLSEFSEQNSKEYFNFLKLKNDNALIKDVPYICYGDECSPSMIEDLKSAGIPVYIKRPLNNAVLLAILNKICSAKEKGEISTDVKKKVTLQDDDCKKLKDKTIPADQKIIIMRNHITKLLAFPITIANILRVTQNERSGAGDLSAIIKTDSAVSAEILKAANSVHFARGNERISSIKDAIVRIGFMESRKLALSLAVFKVAQQKNHTTGFNHTEFWFHSLTVALIAERIARNSQLINPEEAFIGGLLHDIGLLLLNEYFNPIFLEIMEQSIDDGYQFIRCEAMALGITHNLLMKTLFTEWNFPQTLITNVPFFSRIDGLSRENLIKYPLAVIITIAEIIARSLDIGRDADCCTVPIAPQLFQLVKLPFGIQKAFTDNIYASVNMLNKVLKIDNRTLPIINAEQISTLKIVYFSFSEEIFHPVYEYCMNKQYQIIFVRTREEFDKQASLANIIIFNGVTHQHKEFIHQCAALTSIVPQTVKDNTLDTVATAESANNNVHNDTVQMKIILLSYDPSCNTSQCNTDTIATLTYPLDLRILDGIISCFSNNLPPQYIMGKKDKGESVDTGSPSPLPAKAQCILLAHTNNEYRTRIFNTLVKIAGISVTETDHIENEDSFTKLLSQSFKAVFIEFKSPDQVLKIQSLFLQHSSQRPQFVITYNTVKKEDLLPLISAGITLFISENDGDEAIEKRVFTILTSSKNGK